jgi:hypothetical protein
LEVLKMGNTQGMGHSCFVMIWVVSSLGGSNRTFCIQAGFQRYPKVGRAPGSQFTHSMISKRISWMA